MDSMSIYDQLRQVPQNAIKKISGGKLAGMSDINPMWRIKRMTEVFGPYGKGWRMEISERWRDEVQTNSGTEVSANVKVAVSYRTAEGEWSEPAYGYGGSKLLGRGKGSDLDDEAWKMALTDALGVAMKLLGMAADVYFEKDMRDNMTKYSEPAAPRNERPEPERRYLDAETWRKLVRSAARGERTRSGQTCRYWFIKNYAPDEAYLRQFDGDVLRMKAELAAASAPAPEAPAQEAAGGAAQSARDELFNTENNEGND